MGNNNLRKARKAKNDEFYTRLTDIEKELVHYRHHFKDKVVLCNCDDPFESNFFKYFVLNFNVLGLKKLITTCYGTSPIANEQISLFEISGDERQKGRPYKAIVNKVCDTTGDGGIDMQDVINLFKMRENELIELKGDGDFRSDECIELLQEADIVVTNPPFSLFREYISQLMEYQQNFIVIGNKNAITYKEFFPLIMSDQVWLGKNVSRGTMWFETPENELKSVSSYWYTNLDIKKRHEELILVKKYTPEEYPTYDNYDAINVDKVRDIPCDYFGVMGVPITFLDNYNPDQFEILGITDRQNTSGIRTKKYTKKDSDRYNDLNARSVLKLKSGEYKQIHARILIKNKHFKQEVFC